MEMTKSMISDFRQNVRYVLTQNMMKEYFNNWVYHQTKNDFLKHLIEDCKKTSINMKTPSPIFLTKISQVGSGQSTFMPPPSPNSGSMNPFFTNKGGSLSESQIFEEKNFSTNRNQLAESLTNVSILKDFSKVPQFFNPNLINTEQEEKNQEVINKVFERDDVKESDFTRITSEVLGLPKMFNPIFFQKIDLEKRGKLAKKTFLKFYKENVMGKDTYRIFFNIIKYPSKEDYILRDDFDLFLLVLLEVHPGLEFLKSHPDFQTKYTNTVKLRIFYTCNTADNGRLSFREFRKSNLMQTLFKVCEEQDINKVRDYFSYEHFYVLYCRCWELDSQDHNFLIDKENFSKYDGHSLSRKAVDRIFSQVPRKFRSGIQDKMNFEDFVWYMLSEEDKLNKTSIEYWFKVVDLDENGIITPHEMKYFLEEQLHRIEFLNEDSYSFDDIICQFFDMLKPEKEFQITLKCLLANKTAARYFFNTLLNLHKFLAFEKKDPYRKEDEDRNFPDYSDWDKFAYVEYQRLTNEDNDDNDDANDSGIYNSTHDENERVNIESDDILTVDSEHDR